MKESRILGALLSATVLGPYGDDGNLEPPTQGLRFHIVLKDYTVIGFTYRTDAARPDEPRPFRRTSNFESEVITQTLQGCGDFPRQCRNSGGARAGHLSQAPGWNPPESMHPAGGRHLYGINLRADGAMRDGMANFGSGGWEGRRRREQG